MSTEQPPPTADPKLLFALGTLTLHASHAEAAAARTLGLLVSPHQFIGETVTAGATMQWMIERIRALAKLRLEQSDLLRLIDDWAAEAAECNEMRNQLIHGHWLGSNPVTLRTQVRRGELLHTFADRTPEELLALAARFASLADEATHIGFDLATAGLAGVTHVGDGEVRRDGPTSELKVTPPEALGGRPEGSLRVPRRPRPPR